MALENVSSSQFASLSSSATPVVVDFWATWCAPCKALNPVLEQLATEYAGKVKFVKVDVEAEPDLANKYQVRAVPTLLVMQGGVVKKQLVGGQSKEKLKAALESL